MDRLEDELGEARFLDVSEIASTVESVGFECTRCGGCCTADGDDPHTATVFPEEIRTLQRATGREWSEIARPMPFGLDDDGTGETFEWALKVDENGDCVFYEEDEGVGRCTVHEDRPLICRTYPFSLDIGDGVDVPGATVERIEDLTVHECEGLGADIDGASARSLATALKRRTIVELEEAIAVRDAYEPVADVETVVYDSEGPKRPDGTTLS
ncbi:MAG: YkgJ family cysteine cluster protein [Halanaeroarchaeum sp.]